METERCVARCITPSRRACITSLVRLGAAAELCARECLRAYVSACVSVARKPYPVRACGAGCQTNAWPGSCDGLVVAGCSDGAIHILDPRVHYRADSFDIDTPAVVPGPTTPSLQRAERRFTLHEHKNWLVQVAMQRSGSGQAVYSGSISGSIKFWDLRRDVAVRTIKAHQGAMRALVVHDYAPVMARWVGVRSLAGARLRCHTLRSVPAVVPRVSTSVCGPRPQGRPWGRCGTTRASSASALARCLA